MIITFSKKREKKSFWNVHLHPSELSMKTIQPSHESLERIEYVISGDSDEPAHLRSLVRTPADRRHKVGT